MTFCRNEGSAHACQGDPGGSKVSPISHPDALRPYSTRTALYSTLHCPSLSTLLRFIYSLPIKNTQISSYPCLCFAIFLFYSIFLPPLSFFQRCKDTVKFCLTSSSCRNLFHAELNWSLTLAAIYYLSLMVIFFCKIFISTFLNTYSFCFYLFYHFQHLK